MASLTEQVLGQIQSGGIGQMSQALGLGQEEVSKVVGGAVPALVAALVRNSGSAEGASSLLGALDRDHDGSVLDDITGFLGNSASADQGAGIVRHALGSSQGRVENALSQTSGLDAAAVGKIISMVAPLVMGALGRTKQQQGLDAGGLASMLGQERDRARQRSPEAVDMLTRFLDSDGDGSAMDEIAAIGTKMLGGLFK